MENAETTSKKRKWDDKIDNDEDEAKKKAADAARRLNESLAARGFTKEGPETTTGTSHEAIVDINDSPQRRYILHSATLRSYESQFGVAIVPRGRYYPPEEKPDLSDFRGPDSEKPLFLLITGSDASAVQSAKEALEEAASGAAPVLRHPGLGSEGHKKDRIFEKIVTNMDFESAGRPFRLIERLKGPDLSYIRYIEQETNCRVYLRGKGADRNSATANSGAPEEPLYFHIQAMDEQSMQEAKALVEDLLDAIRPEYEKACAAYFAALQAYQNPALVADPEMLRRYSGMEGSAGNLGTFPYAANPAYIGAAVANGFSNPMSEDPLLAPPPPPPSSPPPPPPPPSSSIPQQQSPPTQVGSALSATTTTTLREETPLPPPPPPPPPSSSPTKEASGPWIADPTNSLPRNDSMHETSDDLESFHAVPPPPVHKMKSRHSYGRR